MKSKFSRSWKSSKKPGKQRKYAANAPKHIKSKLLAAHASKELRKQHGKRAITLRKGDKVKILRGQFKGKSGKVESVDTRTLKVYITGIEFVKKDGSKALYPLNPSNLMIEELMAEDKRRMKSRGGKPAENGKKTP